LRRGVLDENSAPDLPTRLPAATKEEREGKESKESADSDHAADDDGNLLAVTGHAA
jgi:hypothetical protein